MAHVKGPEVCSVVECGGKAHAYGLCNKHYQRAYLFGRLNKAGEPEQLINIPRRAQDGRQDDPRYVLWWPRKKAGLLCVEWANDFWAFVDCIGKRPSLHHYFTAPDPEKLYGPDNFEWRKKLSRNPGETKKEWWARKWASRRKHHPSYEANRFLKRKYGITLADYNRMKGEQDNRCAICRQPETAFDTKTHTIKGLSVDHCHKSTKVRELLCFRCNSVIGRLHDDIALLDACRAYLVKHAT